MMQCLKHSFGNSFFTSLLRGALGLGMAVSVWASYVAAEEGKASPNPWGLHSDPAIGLVLANCGNCHSPYLITHHHRSREDWDKTMTKMESNGMASPSDMIRNMLLDYLEKHQGPLIEDRPQASPWGHAAFNANPLW